MYAGQKKLLELCKKYIQNNQYDLAIEILDTLLELPVEVKK
jgi:hypothetical protein